MLRNACSLFHKSDVFGLFPRGPGGEGARKERQTTGMPTRHSKLSQKAQIPSCSTNANHLGKIILKTFALAEEILGRK